LPLIRLFIPLQRNGERESNIEHEIQEILSADPSNGKVQKEGRIADFYMKRDGIEQYFEIKTVKPNIDVFTKSKSKLLEWVARKRFAVKVFLAFPYNPYHPKVGSSPKCGIKPTFSVSLALAGRFFTTSATWKPL